LLADPECVMNRWKNVFNQVLNIRGIQDIRQLDIHMAEPLVPEPRLVKVETAIGKLKRYICAQLLIRFQLNWSKQEVKCYILE
jgi:hypothetical protein